MLALEERRFRRERWFVGAAVAGVLALGVSAVAAWQGQINLNNQRESLRAQTDALTVQIESARLQDHASRYSSVSELSLDVSKFLLEDPRLLPCFQDSECPKDLTNDEWRQARALAYYVLDFYQYLYAQLQNLDMAPASGHFALRGGADPHISDDSWITWSETMVAGFRNSQLLCDALEQGYAAYSSDFVGAVRHSEACVR